MQIDDNCKSETASSYFIQTFNFYSTKKPERGATNIQKGSKRNVILYSMSKELSNWIKKGDNTNG
jgi:hypothetical protein